MEGRVALITGAVGGLGRAFAEGLLDRGMQVCLVDIRQEEGTKTLKDLQRKYGEKKAIFFKCDVTKRDQFEDAFKHTLTEFGRLDVVCNNAGIADEKLWERTLDVNLRATIRGTMLGIKYMSPPQGHGGVIINVASTSGLMSVPKTDAYVASKHGVVGFTRSIGGMSKRHHKVRVNCLCPSNIETDLLEKVFKEVDPKTYEQWMSVRNYYGVMSTAEVTGDFIKLLETDGASGAVMFVTPIAKGIIRLPKDLDQLLKVSSLL